MALIIVKNMTVADLPSLTKLVLRFVYEPEKMSLDEIHLMQESVQGWIKKTKLARENNILTSINDPNSLDNEAEYILGRINWMLQKDARGEFNARKQLFKEHKIDWRKFHNLPNSRTKEDYTKANAMKAEYDKKYPEFR
jgi:hypothetical protein